MKFNKLIRMAFYGGRPVAEAIADLEQQGMNAFVAGKSIAMCPYFPETELGKIWICGYNRAKNGAI